jgi:hypothetical protein
MSITAPVSTLPGVGSPLRLAPVTNLERMYTLDEAWNARDWQTFDAYPSRATSSCTGPAGKTLRREAARIIARSPLALCTAFTDNSVKHPYDVLFGDGAFTAFVTRMTSTFTGPLELPGGGGHRTDRPVVRRRVLNDRPLVGRQHRRGVPQVRQREPHAAARACLTVKAVGSRHHATATRAPGALPARGDRQ